MTEYLITFFKTLRHLSQDRPEWVSDAIAYDEGSLYVLVSVGDARVKVPVPEFDPDPARAAEVAINCWKALTSDGQKVAIEWVKS